MQKGENDEQGLCGSCGMYGRFIYRGYISSEEKAKAYISEMMKDAYQASTKPYFEEWDVQ